MTQRDPKVEDFLRAYEALCILYGMQFAHEDTQGGFEIVDIDELVIPGEQKSGLVMDWIKGARDERTKV